MPAYRGIATVMPADTNSLCSASNSYQVQFSGPGNVPTRFFDNELWTTRPVRGTLQRVLNPDGTWTEKIFFSTFQRQFATTAAPTGIVFETPGSGAVLTPGGGAIITPA